MATVVEPMRAAERPPDQLAALFAGGWPPFIGADAVAAERLPRVRELFRDYELALLVDGELVAAGWGVPLSWAGSRADLPTGYTDSLGRALQDVTSGAGTDTLVICAAQVHPDRQGHGFASQLITALIGVAESTGHPRFLAPLRPAFKSRYPLIPIDDYAAWVRADGLPLDPWLRTHRRMGAQILATAPGSQTMTGTVAQWEGWTGLDLPSSGRYVIPAGLAPLAVDRDADTGVYVEPNIWVRHR